MPARRAVLLDRVVGEVAVNGLGSRSLRDIAAAVGSSHRMLLYHFGSREGLVAAIVESVEASQRALLRELAATTDDPGALVLALWDQVSSPALRPFVRLFFESLAVTAGSHGDNLTAPWLDDSTAAAGELGLTVDATEMRLGVAVTRGLLIDVLASGETEPATAALHRFVELWRPAPRRATRHISSRRSVKVRDDNEEQTGGDR
jgi:AcrR family transcriptional regulator